MLSIRKEKKNPFKSTQLIDRLIHARVKNVARVYAANILWEKSDTSSLPPPSLTRQIDPTRRPAQRARSLYLPFPFLLAHQRYLRPMFAAARAISRAAYIWYTYCTDLLSDVHINARVYIYIHTRGGGNLGERRSRARKLLRNV